MARSPSISGRYRRRCADIEGAGPDNASVKETLDSFCGDSALHRWARGEVISAAADRGEMDGRIPLCAAPRDQHQ